MNTLNSLRFLLRPKIYPFISTKGNLARAAVPLKSREFHRFFKLIIHFPANNQTKMLDTSQCQKPEKRMSFRGIRASKFRHVFGSPAKKEKCFENVRITRNAHEGNYCAVNPKFLGVVVEVSLTGIRTPHL
jgi:hypothetical protein